MNESIKRKLDQLRKESEEARTARRARLDAHTRAVDEAKRPIVRFGCADLAPDTLCSSPYRVLIYSPSSENGPDLDVGAIYLSGKGRKLHLDKVEVYEHAEGRGFGTAALRTLVELARAQDYTHIEGCAAGESLERLERVRKWYRRCGFVLDAEGEAGRIVYDLAVPFPE